MSIAEYYKELNRLNGLLIKYELGESFMYEMLLNSHAYVSMKQFYKEQIEFIKHILEVQFNIDTNDN